MNLFLYIALFLCPYISNAQPLSIGDKLPVPLTDYMAKKLVKSNVAATKDLTIYNFMATTCGSCIRALPAFVQLQKNYEQQFKMVLVSSQAAPKIEAWFAKHPQLRLPVIAADTLMHQYFPHTYISHLVWVNAQHKVVAITSGAYLTQGTLQQALAGTTLHWPVKQDDKSYNYNQPFIGYNYNNLQEAATPRAVNYIAVASHMQGISPRFTQIKDTASGTITYSFINQSLPAMFAAIFNRSRFPLTRFRLCVADSGRFFKEFASLLKDDWQPLHLHCLEARFPLYQSPAHTHQAILLALSNFAGCTASIDSVIIPVLIVSGQPVSLPPPSVEKPLTLDAVVYKLNSQPAAQPVFIDPGTAYGAKLNIAYTAILTRAQMLQSLIQQGYKINTACRKVEVITISDRP